MFQSAQKYARKHALTHTHIALLSMNVLYQLPPFVLWSRQKFENFLQIE